jgi:hypothetical protein
LYELPGEPNQEGCDTTYGNKRYSFTFLMVDDMNDLGVDVRAILRLILKKRAGKAWNGLTRLSIGAIGGVL